MNNNLDDRLRILDNRLARIEEILAVVAKPGPEGTHRAIPNKQSVPVVKIENITRDHNLASV